MVLRLRRPISRDLFYRWLIQTAEGGDDWGRIAFRSGGPALMQRLLALLPLHLAAPSRQSPTGATAALVNENRQAGQPANTEGPEAGTYVKRSPLLVATPTYPLALPVYMTPPRTTRNDDC